MAHLSVARIKTIMKSSADVDFVGKDSVQVVAKATELFLKSLTKAGYKTTKGGKELDYKNLTDVVHSDERYEFLREIMPKKITYLRYKQLMAKKQQQAEKGVKDSDSDSESDSSSSDSESDGSSGDVSEGSGDSEEAPELHSKGKNDEQKKAAVEGGGNGGEEIVQGKEDDKETSGSCGSIVDLLSSSEDEH